MHQIGGGAALSEAVVHPSARLPVCPMIGLIKGALNSFGYYGTVIGRPMLEVEPTGRCGRIVLEASKLSSASRKPSEIESWLLHRQATATTEKAFVGDIISPPSGRYHLLLDRIARTTYVDTVYCYRPSSMVCLSVCHTGEPSKNG